MKRITNYITALLTIAIVLVSITMPIHAISTPYQCKQYLSNADKAIRTSNQSYVTHEFRQSSAYVAMMYMDRYKICKSNLPVRKDINDLRRLLDRVYEN